MIDSILDALGYVGQSIDKAGPRPLRGILGGKPREAMSFIPFSDSLGITDPKDIQSGRNLTDKYGLTDPHSTSWGSAGAGLMAEALLDPIALGGAAKLGLKGARSLAADIARPRRGFMDILPFADRPMDVRKAASAIGPMHDPDVARGTMSSWRMPNQFRDAFHGLPTDVQDRVLSEIPEGAKWYAAGGEGPVLRAPNSSMIKLSPSLSQFGHTPEDFFGLTNHFPAAGRPMLPESLKPIRSMEFGPRDTGVRVEHLHQVNPMEQTHRELLDQLHAVAAATKRPAPLPVRESLSTIRNIDNELMEHIRGRFGSEAGAGASADDLLRQHLTPYDVDLRNLSMTPGGRSMVLHDAGAVTGKDVSVLGYPTEQLPPPEMLRQLLEQGSPEAVRQAMAQSLARGPAGRGIPLPGELAQQRQLALNAIQAYIREHAHLLKPGAVPPAHTPTASHPIIAALEGGHSGL